MAHFYGSIKGQRGEAPRLGTKASGMETYCASWAGAVRCSAYLAEDGEDHVRVHLTPWRGAGADVLLYDGPISGVGLDYDYAGAAKAGMAMRKLAAPTEVETSTPALRDALEATGGFLDWAADHGANKAAIDAIRAMRSAALAVA